jgi:broad specificity phosphatase PhoE
LFIEGEVLFYLIRHGETDYSYKGTMVYQGFGENLAPLTSNGINQIKSASSDSRLLNADIIISSPYTRAMQSAAILSKALQIDIIVEPEIFEWVADKKFVFQKSSVAECRCKEFNECNGNYPDGAERTWENNEMLKTRLTNTLKKYISFNKVIVVCHGMLIHSVYNDHWLANGEIIEFSF